LFRVVGHPFGEVYGVFSLDGGGHRKQPTSPRE